MPGTLFCRDPLYGLRWFRVKPPKVVRYWLVLHGLLAMITRPPYPELIAIK